jgi:hypothetical protein
MVQFIERKLDTNREHQQRDPEVSDDANGTLVRDEAGRMRSNNNTGDQVAYQNRKSQSASHKTPNKCCNQHNPDLTEKLNPDSPTVTGIQWLSLLLYDDSCIACRLASLMLNIPEIRYTNPKLCEK